MLAEQFGCDVTRVYHHSRDVRPRRSRRADKGAMKAIEEDAFTSLSWYTVRGDFSAPTICEVARANNLGSVNPATYNRHLRQKGISRSRNKKDLRPYVSFEAKYPNQLHQIDSTAAQQFYLDDDGTIGYEGPHQRYKNKPGNKKPRITLLALRDDYSRVLYARFYLGNHTYAWMDFLYHAWRAKDDIPGFPFRGMPHFIYTDNDSVVKSKKFTNAMRILDVKIIKHEVGNSRAKGKVENSFKFLQEFEKNTKFGKWKSLEQANADLVDYLYYVNNRPHSTTGVAPFERWVSIPAKRLLDVPDEDIMRLLHMDTIRRKINRDMCVKIDGRAWQLPFREPFLKFIDEMVEIYRMPGEREKIWVVLNDKEYEVQYSEKGLRGLGRHEAPPEPEFVKHKREIEAQENPGLRIRGIYKEAWRRPYISQQGQPFDESRVPADGVKIDQVMRSRTWFVLELQAEGWCSAPPTAEETVWIETIMDGKTEHPESYFRDVLQQLKNGDMAINQRRVAGQA